MLDLKSALWVDEEAVVEEEADVEFTVVVEVCQDAGVGLDAAAFSAAIVLVDFEEFEVQDALETGVVLGEKYLHDTVGGIVDGDDQWCRCTWSKRRRTNRRRVPPRIRNRSHRRDTCSRTRICIG